MQTGTEFLSSLYNLVSLKYFITFLRNLASRKVENNISRYSRSRNFEKLKIF